MCRWHHWFQLRVWVWVCLLLLLASGSAWKSKQGSQSFRRGSVLAHPVSKQHEHRQFFGSFFFYFSGEVGARKTERQRQRDRKRFWLLVTIWSTATNFSLCWRNFFWVVILRRLTHCLSYWLIDWLQTKKGFNYNHFLQVIKPKRFSISLVFLFRSPTSNADRWMIFLDGLRINLLPIIPEKQFICLNVSESLQKDGIKKVVL